MELTLYQIDAFTDKLFSGNPAAVVPLREWIDEFSGQQMCNLDIVNNTNKNKRK